MTIYTHFNDNCFGEKREKENLGKKALYALTTNLESIFLLLTVIITDIMIANK